MYRLVKPKNQWKDLWHRRLGEKVKIHGEEVSKNNGGDRGGSNGSRTRSASCTKRKQFEEVQAKKSQKPTEDDDIVMEDTDEDNNGLKDKTSTLLTGEISNISTTGF